MHTHMGLTPSSLRHAERFYGLQLVARGILPAEHEAAEAPPTTASMDSALLGTSLDLSSASVLSGASLAVLQRLADRLTDGIARRHAGGRI